MTAAQIGLGYLLILAVVAAAFVLGYIVGDWHPDCPTRDACMVQCEDGECGLVRVVP